MIFSRNRNQAPWSWKLRLPVIAVLCSALLLSACDIPGLGDAEDIGADGLPVADEPGALNPDTPRADPDAQHGDDNSPEVQNVARQTDSNDVPDSARKMSRIVEAGTREPRTLNPVLVADPISETISTLVFSGLTRTNPESGEAEPDLAADWEINDDETTYIFRLRNSLTWHDDQPVTAKDVEFTFDLMMDQRTRSPRFSRIVKQVAAVEAIDARSVEFRLHAPYAPFLNTIATFGIVPQHLLENVIPDELAAHPFGVHTAVGTGPFSLDHWERGERIRFDAYRDHHLTPPAFDRYEYAVMPDEASILAGLEAGEIDWAHVSPSMYDEVESLPELELRSIPSFEMICVVLQLDPEITPVFQDETVRRALLMTVEREAMVEDIWRGHAEVAHHTIPSSSWAANEPETRYAYEPGRAEEMLNEAGWIIADDGIREQDGVALQFSILVNGDNPLRRELAEWIVAQWQDIGIGASVTFETWGNVREQITTSRDFESLILGYRWDVDPDQHAMWASDSISDAFNLSGYLNSDVDRLLEEALAATDKQERVRLYAEMQELVLQDLPVLPLAFPNQLIVIGPELHNEDQTAILMRNRSNVAEWDLQDEDTDDDAGG